MLTVPAAHESLGFRDVFPVWTRLAGSGYIFDHNPGKVRSLGGLPPRSLERPAPHAALATVGSQRGLRRIHKVASVQDRVIDIVASQLGVSKDQITAETSFIKDLGADSLDTVELVMELEEEFEINIPDDAAEKIQTVGQAVEFIEKHQS
jgi:acyl carrier protein